MPTDGFVAEARHRHLFQHAIVAHEDTGEVHHLTETDNTLPLHRLCHFVWTYVRARSLEPRCGRDTGRHLYPDVDRLLSRFVQHQSDAFESEYIRNLMWVNEHAGRATHSDRPNELRHRD